MTNQPTILIAPLFFPKLITYMGHGSQWSKIRNQEGDKVHRAAEARWAYVVDTTVVCVWICVCSGVEVVGKQC